MPKQYTVFIIDGAFVDANDCGTTCLRFDALNPEIVQALLEIATTHGYDIVIRAHEEPDNGKKTTE